MDTMAGDSDTLDLLARVKELFEGYFASMHEGWVSEWVDRNMTEDVVLTVIASEYTESPCSLTLQASCQGKQAVCMHYNEVLARVWGGPDCVVTWRPDMLVPKGKDIVRADFTQSISRSCEGRPVVQVVQRSHLITLRDGLISKVVVTGTPPPQILPRGGMQESEEKVPPCPKCPPPPTQ
eukprot:Sspe_Gene.119336::Locus_114944_Transcript_1_1_Confidence_1.000_Length_575::g.119336::m.119336